MAFLQVANRAISKLTADISATDTSFTVTTGDGNLFPTGNFVVTIDDERILVGSRSGDTFSSLVRGYDGTTAASHTAGTRIELRIIARHIQELQDFCNTKGQANGLATLDGNALVPLSQIPTPLTGKDADTVDGYHASDLEKVANKGVANGYASLDANGLVIQNPTNATSTPTASKIPIADSNGSLNSWINGQNINAQTGTTYTFVLSDAGKLVTFNNASAITVTIPANSSVAFPIGTHIDCMQLGAGKVTFSPASGVTLNSKNGNKSISAQYVGVTLVKIGTDTWVLLGDLVT